MTKERQGDRMRRTALVVTLLLVASVSGVLGVSGSAGAASVPGYQALTPSRILDTRTDAGAPGPVGPNSSITLDVTGVGGVPEEGVGAVVLNVTGTEATEDTYVRVWPGDQPMPHVSNLNVVPGEDTPNVVIATVAATGTVNLYNYAGSVHLIADVTGWFPPGSGYNGLNP